LPYSSGAVERAVLAPDGFHVHVREPVAVDDKIPVTVQIQDV
jgi:hypothetical protein